MVKIVTESAVLTAGYPKHIAPLKHISPIARLARAEKNDGAIVVDLPIDHIIWSEKVDDLASYLTEEMKASKGAGLEVWVTDDFSSMARSKLSAMGWKLHTKVRSQLMPKQQ